jgi:predicted nucleic acid-binding protein
MKQGGKKIFFDANVIIDLINDSNDFSDASLAVFHKLRKQTKALYCSPTSFAITYYFLAKLIKDKKVLNKKAVALFSGFIFTREDAVIMEKVNKSSFTDLEDALQYFSAMDAGVDLIITKNHFDFSKSAIPVYHPLQYINEFLL